MNERYDVHSLKQYQNHNTNDDLYRFKLISEHCFGNVLDVGCGLGLLKKYLDNCKVNRYIGLDVDGKIDVHGSVYDLPFKDEIFDTVVMSEVLEHLEHPLDALREVKRVCKSRIILSVPNPYSVQQLYTIFVHRYSLESENHILAFSDGEINRICHRLNLKLEKKLPMKFREPLFHKYLPIRTKLFAGESVYIIKK
ncbi:MAG: class I SAM-dependent methyltransferase [Methanophagales archaeon]|nr:class I SAM-dependent methyltransferase [Methanophagales archaeon]